MEKITDYIVPGLGLCVAIISVRKAVLEGWKTLATWELIISILIMGAYILIARQNSKDNNTLQGNVTTLLNARKIDSTNNRIFQNYLKDTFGIEIKNNKPIISNSNYFKTYYNSYYRVNSPTNIIDTKKDHTKSFIMEKDSANPVFLTPGSPADIEQYRLSRNGVELPTRYFHVEQGKLYFNESLLKGDEIIIHWRG